MSLANWQLEGDDVLLDTNSTLGTSGVDADYKPDAAGDGVVDVGADLSAIFTTDKDGTTRGALWDIGAYELVGGGGGGGGGVSTSGTEAVAATVMQIFGF